MKLYKGEPGPTLQELEIMDGNMGEIEKEWTEPQQDWRSSGSITLRWQSDSSVERSNMTAIVDIY